MTQAKIVITADVVDGVPKNLHFEGTDVSVGTLSVMLAYFVDCYVKELAKEGKECVDVQADFVRGFAKTLE